MIGHYDVILVRESKVENMYCIDFLNKIKISNVCTFAIDSHMWHLRLGHINKDKMLRMCKSGLIPNLQEIDSSIYEPCVQGR